MNRNNVHQYNIIPEDYPEEDTGPHDIEFHREAILCSVNRYIYSRRKDWQGQPKYPAHISRDYKDYFAIRDYERDQADTIRQDLHWHRTQKPLAHKLKWQRVHNQNVIVTSKCNQDCIKKCNKWLKKHPKSSIKKIARAFGKFDKIRRTVTKGCTFDPNLWSSERYLHKETPTCVIIQECFRPGASQSIYQSYKKIPVVWVHRL